MLRTMPECSLFSYAESSEQTLSIAVTWFFKILVLSWEQFQEHFLSLFWVAHFSHPNFNTGFSQIFSHILMLTPKVVGIVKRQICPGVC